MSHSTTQSKDYPKSEIMVDSLIIFIGKNNHYLDYNFPQRFPKEISDNIEFQFRQVLDLLGIIVTMV